MGQPPFAGHNPQNHVLVPFSKVSGRLVEGILEPILWIFAQGPTFLMLLLLIRIFFSTRTDLEGKLMGKLL